MNERIRGRENDRKNIRIRKGREEKWAKGFDAKKR